MSERPKEHVSKTCEVHSLRGFKSHRYRHCPVSGHRKPSNPRVRGFLVECGCSRLDEPRCSAGSDKDDVGSIVGPAGLAAGHSRMPLPAVARESGPAEECGGPTPHSAAPVGKSPWRVTAVMIRRAFDTPQSVAEGFLCLETWVSYVLKLDTTDTAKQYRYRSGAFPERAFSATARGSQIHVGPVPW